MSPCGFAACAEGNEKPAADEIHHSGKALTKWGGFCKPVTRGPDLPSQNHILFDTGRVNCITLIQATT
jgi:hypothetical protein